MNKKTMEQLEILFRSAHALAKHGRPYSDFKWLCMLDEHSRRKKSGLLICEMG